MASTEQRSPETAMPTGSWRQLTAELLAAIGSWVAREPLKAIRRSNLARGCGLRRRRPRLGRG